MKLETPIQPRFIREGRKFLVAAPAPYLSFASGTIIAGGAFFLLGILGIVGFWPAFGRATLIFLVGIAVAVSGFLAHLSLDFAEFDIKERIYKRRQGSGALKSLRKGNFNELQVITFSAGPGSGLRTGKPVARLILYWKNPAQAPLVVFDQVVPTLPGQAIPDYGSVQQFGAHIASAIGIPYQIQPFANF